MAYNSVGEGPVETILNVWTEEGGRDIILSDLCLIQKTAINNL